MQTVEIFTDGACIGNPGPGGWGALMRFKDAEKRISGGFPQTTNNQMELQAAIEALSALKNPCEVRLTTDSEYLRLGMTQWLPKWQARGWKRPRGGEIKNLAQWQQLAELAQVHEITWLWVRGHSGHPENEIADELARQAAEDQLR